MHRCDGPELLRMEPPRKARIARRDPLAPPRIEYPTIRTNHEQGRVTDMPFRTFHYDRLRILALLAAIAFSFQSTASSGYGQTLKRKTDADSESPEVVENEAQDSSSDVPVWERKVFAALTVIDDAIAEYESANTEAETARNSIVRKDMLLEAENAFSEAVNGQRFFVHFKLTQIDAGKTFSRFKQSIELTLHEPTFPGHQYGAKVTVVISPSQARKLTIGSLVRVEGQLQERSRDSFDRIGFYRDPNTPPLAGDKQSSRFNYSQSRSRYTFIFHVNKVRVLAGKPLAEYHAFLPRYQAKLAAYAPADR